MRTYTFPLIPCVYCYCIQQIQPSVYCRAYAPHLYVSVGFNYPVWYYKDRVYKAEYVWELTYTSVLYLNSSHDSDDVHVLPSAPERWALILVCTFIHIVFNTHVCIPTDAVTYTLICYHTYIVLKKRETHGLVSNSVRIIFVFFVYPKYSYRSRWKGVQYTYTTLPGVSTCDRQLHH